MLRTYYTKCVNCKQDRWPTLPEPPTKYTCSRCLAMRPGDEERRVAKSERMRKWQRQRRAQPDSD